MTTHTSLRLLPALLLLFVAACSPTEERPPSKEAPPPTMDTAPAVPQTVEWKVTYTGVGPIRVGMTVAQAREALNGALVIKDSSTACYYARLGKGPEDVSLMITNGQIARVDIIGDSIATEAGARVGDTEDRIKTLYAGRVEVQPHKYTNGHYLVVKPDAGESRLIFETDGSKVTLYRAGKLPEVEWVEGCY